MKIKILIKNIILTSIILFDKLKNYSIFCCILNGNIEGKCISRDLIENQIPFCKKYLSDYICVPYFQNIWPEWTNNTIDEIVEKEIMINIETEFNFELTAQTYSLPLINNVGCLNSYINLICRRNFLPCDPNSDKTIPPCKKVCERFLNSCGTRKFICNDYKEEDCSE